MASSAKILEEALQKKGIKRDKDVEELYLSHRNLSEMEDLSRFRNLTKLWINGNKLRSANFISLNFHLSELYLHNNHLSDISGCLKHLTCLTVLTLHNNQLIHLDKIMKEFNKMTSLSVLNLFNNPAAQEPCYRLFVIHSCPSLKLLDRSEVTRAELMKANEIFKPDQSYVKSKIAFGRKTEGPPITQTISLNRSTSAKPNFTETQNVHLKASVPETADDVINARFLMKSLTMYSIFDWSQVPRLQERRVSCDQLRLPRILTYVYR